jgi:hypothetical protein
MCPYMCRSDSTMHARHTNWFVAATPVPGGSWMCHEVNYWVMNLVSETEEPCRGQPAAHMAPTSLLLTGYPVPAYLTRARVLPLMSSGRKTDAKSIASSLLPSFPSHPALCSAFLREVTLILLISRSSSCPWNWLLPQAYPTSAHPTPNNLFVFRDPSTLLSTHPAQRLRLHDHHHGSGCNSFKTGSSCERSMVCALRSLASASTGTNTAAAPMSRIPVIKTRPMRLSKFGPALRRVECAYLPVCAHPLPPGGAVERGRCGRRRARRAARGAPTRDARARTALRGRTRAAPPRAHGHVPFHVLFSTRDRAADGAFEPRALDEDEDTEDAGMLASASTTSEET